MPRRERPSASAAATIASLSSSTTRCASTARRPGPPRGELDGARPDRRQVGLEDLPELRRLDQHAAAGRSAAAGRAGEAPRRARAAHRCPRPPSTPRCARRHHHRLADVERAERLEAAKPRFAASCASGGGSTLPRRPSAPEAEARPRARRRPESRAPRRSRPRRAAGRRRPADVAPDVEEVCPTDGVDAQRAQRRPSHRAEQHRPGAALTPDGSR